jgi:hypothetical protein
LCKEIKQGYFSNERSCVVKSQNLFKSMKANKIYILIFKTKLQSDVKAGARLMSEVSGNSPGENRLTLAGF